MAQSLSGALLGGHPPSVGRAADVRFWSQRLLRCKRARAAECAYRRATGQNQSGRKQQHRAPGQKSANATIRSPEFRPAWDPGDACAITLFSHRTLRAFTFFPPRLTLAVRRHVGVDGASDPGPQRTLRPEYACRQSAGPGAASGAFRVWASAVVASADQSGMKHERSSARTRQRSSSAG